MYFAFSLQMSQIVSQFGFDRGWVAIIRQIFIFLLASAGEIPLCQPLLDFPCGQGGMLA